jgi:uncharacterized protein (TIGR01777 family)
MNYLITGGTGLIGRALIEKLATPHTVITVLTRDLNKAKKHLGYGVTFINALLIEHIENCDVVINLAGEAIADNRWSNVLKDKICQSRWQITTQIAELITQAKQPPSLFISGSAIGIYGRQNAQAIDESFQEFHQEFTYDVCQHWEQLAANVSSAKTRVALLRTGIVLADKKGALAKMHLPFKLGLGGKIGSGKQIMSWIHIEDAVNAILHIQKTETLKGAINLTAPSAVSNKEFCRAFAHHLKRPCLFTSPVWLLKLVLGEMSDLLVFGQNIIPKKLLCSGFTFQYPNIDDAFSNLIKNS